MPPAEFVLHASVRIVTLSGPDLSGKRGLEFSADPFPYCQVERVSSVVSRRQALDVSRSEALCSTDL